jgi:hypothetical protein
MSAVRSGSSSAALDQHLYAVFAAAVPKILNVANYRFRHIPCPDTREDYICETLENRVGA